MLTIKQWLVATLTADTTLQGFLKDQNGNTNIFPADVDLTPEQFPAITYQDSAGTILSVPKGMHIGRVQLDLWSTTDALETEEIYDRVQQLLNFQSSQTATISITGTLWWLREELTRDMHEPQRRLWHKLMDIKYWVNKTDNS